MNENHYEFGSIDGPFGGQLDSGVLLAAMGQVIKHASIGFILVEESLRVRFANGVALRRLCEEGRALSTTCGRLHAATRQETRELQALVAAAVRPQSSVAGSMALNGSTPAGVMHIMVVSLQSCRSAEGGADPPGQPPLAIVIMGKGELVIAGDRLRRAYNLTPAEAQLLAGLVAGERLAGYAARNGIGLTTVRTHLRSLFVKTGETRQSDLIRRALSDPVLRLGINLDAD